MSDQQVNPKTAEYAKQLMARNPAPKPWIKWSIVSALVVLVACSSVWAFRSYNHRKLVASLQNDPRKVRQATEEGKISGDDARNIWEEQQKKREAEEDKRMDGYFALPEGKERTAYLDKLIDEMEARRKEWEKRASTRPARDRSTTRPTPGPTTRPGWGNRGGGGDQTAQMRGRMESGNPARKAQRAQMMTDMMQRMHERGMTMQPGRGGMGGMGFGGPRGGDGGRGPR